MYIYRKRHKCVGRKKQKRRQKKNARQTTQNTVKTFVFKLDSLFTIVQYEHHFTAETCKRL